MLLLTVSPEQFEIKYPINPWMREAHEVNHLRAVHQYLAFKQTLERFGTVFTIPVKTIDPTRSLPDIIYAADAAVFLPGLPQPTAILSRMSRKHRVQESHHWEEFFETANIRLLHLPSSPGIFFEGSGEAIFTPDFKRCFCGYGIRTSKQGAMALNILMENEYRRQDSVDSKPIFHFIKLINPKYFHLDLCFRPLQHGYALIRRNAISPHSVELIEAIYGRENLIDVSENEPFACNGIVHDNYYICASGISAKTIKRIEEIGCKVITTPLSEFEKSGGSLKCMVLPIH